jgi:hypothetical protein
MNKRMHDGSCKLIIQPRWEKMSAAKTAGTAVTLSNNQTQKPILKRPDDTDL